MDIVRTLTFAHLKASFQNLKLKQKIFLAIFLLALTLNLAPQKTYAATIPQIPQLRKIPPLVFNMQDKSYLALLDGISANLTEKYTHERVRQKAMKHNALVTKVQTYLSEQNSPLASYAPVLISVSNWKQIIALSNAESSLCRNYPQSTSNCWGVGGSTLWKLGNNLGDGILAMNQFLSQYPRNTKLKYSQMTFKQMNGLYKQPAAQHWVYNAQKVYDDLSDIEKNI